MQGIFTFSCTKKICTMQSPGGVPTPGYHYYNVYQGVVQLVFHFLQQINFLATKINHPEDFLYKIHKCTYHIIISLSAHFH